VIFGTVEMPQTNCSFEPDVQLVIAVAAAVDHQRHKPAADHERKTARRIYEAWAKVLDVNTMGPLRVSEAFVDHVARSERKLIVTLTSGMGSITDNSVRRFPFGRSGRSRPPAARQARRSGALRPRCRAGE
jgi:NAD(P)-dependent dehydrogenase (short-subunit alcohol dehydrogenase family)